MRDNNENRALLANTITSIKPHLKPGAPTAHDEAALGLLRLAAPKARRRAPVLARLVGRPPWSCESCGRVDGLHEVRVHLLPGPHAMCTPCAKHEAWFAVQDAADLIQALLRQYAQPGIGLEGEEDEGNDSDDAGGDDDEVEVEVEEGGDEDEHVRFSIPKPEGGRAQEAGRPQELLLPLAEPGLVPRSLETELEVADKAQAGEGAAATVVSEAEGWTLHLSTKSATGYLGVRAEGSHFRAYVTRAGSGCKQVGLGTHATAVEAAVSVARWVSSEGRAESEKATGKDEAKEPEEMKEPEEEEEAAVVVAAVEEEQEGGVRAEPPSLELEAEPEVIEVDAEVMEVDAEVEAQVEGAASISGLSSEAALLPWLLRSCDSGDDCGLLASSEAAHPIAAAESSELPLASLIGGQPAARPYSRGRNAWQPAEDQRLHELVPMALEKHGGKVPSNLTARGKNGFWQAIADQIPGRDQTSCHGRWTNHLAPKAAGRKVGGWTAEEDTILIAKEKELGTKFTAMQDFLPGRTGRDIANRWHHSLKKQDHDGPGEAPTERAAYRCFKCGQPKKNHICAHGARDGAAPPPSASPPPLSICEPASAKSSFRGPCPSPASHPPSCAERNLGKSFEAACFSAKAEASHCGAASHSAEGRSTFSLSIASPCPTAALKTRSALACASSSALSRVRSGGSPSHGATLPARPYSAHSVCHGATRRAKPAASSTPTTRQRAMPTEPTSLHSGAEAKRASALAEPGATSPLKRRCRSHSGAASASSASVASRTAGLPPSPTMLRTRRSTSAVLSSSHELVASPASIRRSSSATNGPHTASTQLWIASSHAAASPSLRLADGWAAWAHVLIAEAPPAADAASARVALEGLAGFAGEPGDADATATSSADGLLPPQPIEKYTDRALCFSTRAGGRGRVAPRPAARGTHGNQDGRLRRHGLRCAARGACAPMAGGRRRGTARGATRPRRRPRPRARRRRRGGHLRRHCLEPGRV